MLTYEQIKSELQARRENTKHFTKSFYKLYLDSLNAARKDDEGWYTTPDGVLTRHCWDAVRSSRFYRENGGCYCEFLSLVYGRV